MSFFKSLMLAIIATIFLTYVLGASALELFDLDVYMNDSLVEPAKAISISALVVVVLMLIAVAIILSVFGSVIFIGVINFWHYCNGGYRCLLASIFSCGANLVAMQR